MPVAAGATAVIVMIAVTIALGFLPYSGETLRQATTHGMISIHPFARFFEFACGMCAARLWMSRPTPQASPGAFTALEIAAVALVATSVIGFQHLAAALELRGLPDALTLWIHFGSSAVPFAVLIYVLAHARGYLARFLSVPFLVVLGEVSFAMYLLHQLVLRVMVHAGLQAPPGLVWPAFALYVVFVIGLSYGVWILVERPARRTLNQLLRREPPHTVPLIAAGDNDQPALQR
jgi:peptidoglycan/LPS O-acetylase OafA/YrhL